MTPLVGLAFDLDNKFVLPFWTDRKSTIVSNQWDDTNDVDVPTVAW